jgi:hypothetical protein
MFAHILPLIAVASRAFALSDTCREGFTICEPPGATTLETPEIGGAKFPDLYNNILRSSLPEFTSRRSSLSPRSSASLCCIASLSCLTMANLALPFCYDEYTTNYFLPDNSYGTLVGGAYNSSAGDVANLQTGDYVLASGKKGNIYSDNEAAKPNTLSLPIPSQWTSGGLGSAIPASGLGGAATKTYTSIVPGYTLPAFDPQVSTKTNIPGAEVVTTTLEERTREVKTVSPVVTTVMMTEMEMASASASASAARENIRCRMQASLMPLKSLTFALVVLLI